MDYLIKLSHNQTKRKIEHTSSLKKYPAYISCRIAVKNFEHNLSICLVASLVNF